MLSTSGRDGVICLWDMRAQGQRSSESGIDVLTPVLRIPCAGGHVVKARRATAPVMKSVTSVLYLDGDPFGLTSSSSFDGYVTSLGAANFELTAHQYPPPLGYPTSNVLA